MEQAKGKTENGRFFKNYNSKLTKNFLSDGGIMLKKNKKLLVQKLLKLAFACFVLLFLVHIKLIIRENIHLLKKQIIVNSDCTNNIPLKVNVYISSPNVQIQI